MRIPNSCLSVAIPRKEITRLNINLKVVALIEYMNGKFFTSTAAWKVETQKLDLSPTGANNKSIDRMETQKILFEKGLN